jgi:hypothetical protein
LTFESDGTPWWVNAFVSTGHEFDAAVVETVTAKNARALDAAFRLGREGETPVAKSHEVQVLDEAIDSRFPPGAKLP